MHPEDLSFRNRVDAGTGLSGPRRSTHPKCLREV